MKSVLISIHPEWCEKICHEIGKDETGKPIYEKRIEVRKSAPKETPFKAYIYATRPKKFYKCGAVGTSDELLWLANGKVEMGDGFKFWADGDEYQCLNGRIIGEFICDRIDRIKKRGINNNFDYCYLSLNEWGNDDIEIEIKDIQKSCISKSELNAYGENSSCLYAWHISDLKIYDKPKELSEFFTPMGKRPSYMLERPPQSWQYVDEVKV